MILFFNQFNFSSDGFELADDVVVAAFDLFDSCNLGFSLRAGAALIIAGLNAEGETKVAGVEKIERGYDDIVGKLKSIGADVELVEESC